MNFERLCIDEFLMYQVVPVQDLKNTISLMHAML